MGQAHRGSSPYQVFKTRDGWITIGGAQQNFWQRLCELLDLRHLLDDARFATNAARVRHNKDLVPLLQARLEAKPSAHWLAALEAAEIPAGPVLTHDQILEDPQILARDMVTEVTHPTAGRMKTLGVTVKLSETPGSIRRPAPRVGEHTQEVLSELGVQAKRVSP
jgi:crotonobetainyl-CoA:carnitine CoA-transferase CaiB-like acyl-CoA transferase